MKELVIAFQPDVVGSRAQQELKVFVLEQVGRWRLGKEHGSPGLRGDIRCAFKCKRPDLL